MWNFSVIDIIIGFVLCLGQSIHWHGPPSVAEVAYFMSSLKTWWCLPSADFHGVQNASKISSAYICVFAKSLDLMVG